MNSTVYLYGLHRHVFSGTTLPLMIQNLDRSSVKVSLTPLCST